MRRKRRMRESRKGIIIDLNKRRQINMVVEAEATEEVGTQIMVKEL